MQRIEGNNRMGKTRDFLKKIPDTKGIFHAKMGSIKDRNGMDLTEAEDIKKRWQEYTEKLFKKYLHDPDNHNGMITHPVDRWVGKIRRRREWQPSPVFLPGESPWTEEPGGLQSMELDMTECLFLSHTHTHCV